MCQVSNKLTLNVGRFLGKGCNCQQEYRHNMGKCSLWEYCCMASPVGMGTPTTDPLASFEAPPTYHIAGTGDAPGTEGKISFLLVHHNEVAIGQADGSNLRHKGRHMGVIL